MRTSNYGYETAVYADSPNTARYAGMNSMRLQSSVLLISGAIAGVGGAMYVVGPAGKVDPGLLQIGLGYAGIVVAMLMASADVKSQMFEFTLAPPDQLD
ncbi:MAG: ABC transporter permease [Actinobacteria bacterium]|nr:ABC transporter permease [Actinomycetota bacterium]